MAKEDINLQGKVSRLSLKTLEAFLETIKRLERKAESAPEGEFFIPTLVSDFTKKETRDGSQIS